MVAALAGFALASTSGDAADGTAAAPAETAAASTSVGCDSASPPPVTPAVIDSTLTDQGRERAYRVTLPVDYDGTTAAPVILLFHGTGGTPDEIEAYTGLVAEATARGYVIITPQGLQRESAQGALPAAWDVPGFRTGVDDVAFTEALLAQAGADYCLAPDRVFATGISAGGAFPAYLACESDLLAGLAPIAGANLIRPCTDGGPVSFMGFHGTADFFVSYDGLTADGQPLPAASSSPQPAPTASDPASPLPSGSADGFYNGPALQTAAGWAQRAGCTEYVDEAVAADVTRRVYDCPSGVAVVQYTVADGGHTWPGADPAVRTECCGATTDSIEANTLMLDFFDAVGRQTA
jgi:polyhydroxybutyrate depolymerase